MSVVWSHLQIKLKNHKKTDLNQLSTFKLYF